MRIRVIFSEGPAPCLEYSCVPGVIVRNCLHTSIAALHVMVQELVIRNKILAEEITQLLQQKTIKEKSKARFERKNRNLQHVVSYDYFFSVPFSVCPRYMYITKVLTLSNLNTYFRKPSIFALTSYQSAVTSILIEIGHMGQTERGVKKADPSDPDLYKYSCQIRSSNLIKA